jgi:hypothetical protein
MSKFFASDEIMTERIQAKGAIDGVTVLAKLARSKDTITRIGVAANISTLADDLARLAKDKDWGVRAAVAANVSAPAEARTVLKSDTNTWVRDAAK